MPLPKRTNIVLTHDKDYDAKGAIVVGSKEELLDELEEYKDEDIFIIGGESIYRMMLPYCDKAYVTRTDFAYDADTYFPNLDEMPEWKLVKRVIGSFSMTAASSRTKIGTAVAMMEASTGEERFSPTMNNP